MSAASKTAMERPAPPRRRDYDRRKKRAPIRKTGRPLWRQPLMLGLVVLLLGCGGGAGWWAWREGWLVEARARLDAVGLAVVGAITPFKLVDVTVEGRDYVEPAAILGALGVKAGDSLLGIDLQAARQRLEAIDWVESATVERRLPDTLYVTLKERRAVAIWQNGSEYTLIDRDGRTVRDICRAAGMPSSSTVRLWVVEDRDGFAARYRQAREHYRQFCADHGISLGGANGWQRFIQETCRSRDGRAAFEAYREQRRLSLAAPAKLHVLEQLLDRHRQDRVLIFTYDNATVYQIARRFLHANRLRRDIKHHGRFHFIGMGAPRFPELFLHRVFLRKFGVAQEDPVFGEFVGRLRQRPERRKAGVENVKAARPVMRERMNDVREHGTRGLELEGCGTGIFQKRGIVTIVDCGSHHHLHRPCGKNPILEIFSHHEIVVELKMSPVLFGFRAQRDHDHGIRGQPTLRFVPRHFFQQLRSPGAFGPLSRRG